VRVGSEHPQKETVCTIKIKSDPTGLIAVCVAPPAPKTPPVVAETKVGRNNFGGGGTVFISKTTGSAICVIAPFAPKIAPITNEIVAEFEKL
jgi:hypothetical protein